MTQTMPMLNYLRSNNSNVNDSLQNTQQIQQVPSPSRAGRNMRPPGTASHPQRSIHVNQGLDSSTGFAQQNQSDTKKTGSHLQQTAPQQPNAMKRRGDNEQQMLNYIKVKNKLTI